MDMVHVSHYLVNKRKLLHAKSYVKLLPVGNTEASLPLGELTYLFVWFKHPSTVP